MNIIHRNFFRLLRAGAYGSKEQIEPMSVWKWRQVLKCAQQTGVVPLLYDGVTACSDQFFMKLPDAMRDQWQQEAMQAEQHHREASADVAALLGLLSGQQLRPILLETWTVDSLYDVPEHHRIGVVSIYYPFTTQGKKADEWALAVDETADSPRRHLLRYSWKSLRVEHRHRMQLLNNKLNDITLQDIISKEWLEGGTSHVVIEGQRIETVAPTLAMLLALLAIMKATLKDGLQLWQVVDLGMMLRKQGDRVDYVKLQAWLERLHIGRMTQLIGQVLKGVLGFSADEIPFIQDKDLKGDADSLASGLLRLDGRPASRYMRYCPGETISSMVASITHSLGNIEE